MKTAPTDLLSPAQAAAMLGVHPETLRRWAVKGRIPCYRPGGPGTFPRYRRADLEAAMQRTAPTA